MAKTMQTARTPPKRAQPKRKRTEVTYYESSSDESEAEESDASDAAPSSKKLKYSYKAVSDRPLPKNKIFPFALLPAELKNQIYETALTDLNDIFLISKTRQYRRTVERDVSTFANSVNYDRRRRHRYDRYHNQPSQQSSSSSTPAKPIALVPSILLLNKEIYAEAQPVLYASNNFVVEDTAALHAFLANIGLKNCATLTDLTIRRWGLTRGHKALNHPALSMLASAVNLQRLHIDCRISWSGPKYAARQLYRDGHHWLEAMGVAKGRFDAAVEIVEVIDENFEEYRRNGDQEKPTLEEQLETFRTEMRKLLRRK